MIGDAPQVLIRPMRAGDLEAVMSIAASVNEAPQWPRAAYLSALNPGSTVQRIAQVAEFAEGPKQPVQVVGFAVASLLGPQAELESIAIGKAAQRKGIGRTLISAILRELRKAGDPRADEVQELVLEVRTSNLRALGFYGSLGFLQTGLRKRYYAAPEEDAVLMSLPLA